MASRPPPILVYSAFVDGADRDNAAAALAAGAVDVMEKPAADGPGGLDEFAEALRRRLRFAGRVKVITHPRAGLGGRPPTTLSTRSLGGPSQGMGTAVVEPPARTCDPRPRAVRVVAIGASTGGPHALSHLLAELPADFQAAVVVVQH